MHQADIPWAMAYLVIRYLFAHLKRLEIVLLQLPDGLCPIEPYAALIVQEQAAVIEVDGADNPEFVVTHEGLGMDEPRRVFVNPDPAFSSSS